MNISSIKDRIQARRKNKYNVIIKKIFFNTFIKRELDKYNDEISSRSELLKRIEQLYSEWSANPEEFLGLKYPELVRELDDLGEIPEKISFWELLIFRERNRDLEKIITQRDREFVSSFAKKFLRQTYKSLPIMFVVGGFIRALIFSSILNIDLSLLFRIEDYWNLGVSAFALIVPVILLTGAIVSISFLLSWTISVQYDSKVFRKPFIYRHAETLIFWILFFISLSIFFIVSTWQQTLLSFTIFFLILIYWVDTSIFIKSFHYFIPVVLVLFISLYSYLEIKYETVNGIDDNHYIIQSKQPVPNDFKYIFSTSNYHIFSNGVSSVLLPISDIIRIEIEGDSKTEENQKQSYFNNLEAKFINNFKDFASDVLSIRIKP